MRYGLDVPNMAGFGDVHRLVDLARSAEAAGWDGFFLWDSVLSPAWDEPFRELGRDDKRAVADPWVALAAIAAATERIRIGTMVTPLTRYRPWALARQLVTLDHLSRGRLTLAVGLGSVDDGAFARVNEETDRRARAQRTDEALAILEGLLSGDPFSFAGDHFRVEEMQFLPRPVQEPRIPIWVVGVAGYERSIGRALRYDGLIPQVLGRDGGVITPAELAELTASIREQRPPSYDIVTEGETPAGDPDAARETVLPFAEAGATWWLEGFVDLIQTGGVRAVRERVAAGPPRVD